MSTNSAAEPTAAKNPATDALEAAKKMEAADHSGALPAPPAAVSEEELKA